MSREIVCSKFAKLGDSDFILSLYFGLHDVISNNPTKCCLWLCFATSSCFACILVFILFALTYALSTLASHCSRIHFNLVPICHHSNETPPSWSLMRSQLPNSLLSLSPWPRDSTWNCGSPFVSWKFLFLLLWIWWHLCMFHDSSPMNLIALISLH